MRILRSLLVLALGAWGGMMAAAAFVKRAVPSHGGQESDELSLVAVFDGIELTNRSKSFAGGSMLAWFGGIVVDLRDAELAPDARLKVHALFGGIVLRTPPNWRIESNAKSLAGGVDVRAAAGDDPDAPVLALDGLAVFGGVTAAAAPEHEAESAQNL